MSMSLIIATIGTAAAALAALERIALGKEEESRRRRRLTYATVVATLFINVVLHWFQYHNVTTAALKEQKKLERDLAFSLWAYTSEELPALKYLANSRHKYVLGYYYFKHDKIWGNKILAQDAFKESIEGGDFVAPSKYLLAVMARLKKPMDLTEVRELLESGIAYDPDYSSLYVERGILRTLQTEPKAAIDDLRRAVDLNKVHCYTITRNSVQPDHPLSRLQQETSFKSLKEDCEVRERGLDPLPSSLAGTARPQ